MFELRVGLDLPLLCLKIGEGNHKPRVSATSRNWENASSQAAKNKLNTSVLLLHEILPTNWMSLEVDSLSKIPWFQLCWICNREDMWAYRTSNLQEQNYKFALFKSPSLSQCVMASVKLTEHLYAAINMLFSNWSTVHLYEYYLLYGEFCELRYIGHSIAYFCFYS